MDSVRFLIDFGHVMVDKHYAGTVVDTYVRSRTYGRNRPNESGNTPCFKTKL